MHPEYPTNKTRILMVPVMNEERLRLAVIGCGFLIAALLGFIAWVSW